MSSDSKFQQQYNPPIAIADGVAIPIVMIGSGSLPEVEQVAIDESVVEQPITAPINRGYSNNSHTNGGGNYGSVMMMAHPANEEAVALLEATNVETEEDEPQEQEEREQQQSRGPIYQDIPFAVLFYIHIAFMLWLGNTFGPNGEIDTGDITPWNVSSWRSYVDDTQGNSTSSDPNNNMTEQDWVDLQQFLEEAKDWVGIYPARILHNLIYPACAVSFLLAYIATAFLIPSCPTTTVVACLLGTLGWASLFLLWLLCANASSGTGAVVMVLIVSFVLLSVILWYLRTVWNLIPFASANLRIALRGISANCGVYFVSLGFSLLGIFWICWWFYTIIGVMTYQMNQYEKHHPKPEGVTEKEYEDSIDDPTQFWTFVGMIVSLYWTNKIILNTVQVTVSGVMATWCFDKSWADNCCSPAIFGSLYRSFTYSFGSICLGSLLQAAVEFIRCLVDNAKRQQQQTGQGGGLFCCCLDCLINILGEMLEYFNQWAYVFCGIYGYSYLESGRLVVQLFRQRGFTSFVTNDLVGYVLAHTGFLVGIGTGIVGVIIQMQVDSRHADDTGDNSSDDDGGGGSESYIFGSLWGPKYWAFWLSFLVAIVISSVMMNVVKGAVNTLVVCFADSPDKLEDNHPELTQQLMNAWASAFPSSRSDIGRPRYSVLV